MAKGLQALQSVAQDQRVVQFVAGAFERLGVIVRDTGEEFTCLHRGERIDFEDRVVRGRVDYTVEVDAAQLDRLATQTAGGQFDEGEKFRIIRALFTPATATLMQDQPVLSHPLVRRLAGVENLIHVRLTSPTTTEQDATHTLIYTAGQWLVFPGLHGKAKRTFTLSPDEAMDYQRHIFTAVKAQSMGEWLHFGTWYRQWRKKVSHRGSDREPAQS